MRKYKLIIGYYDVNGKKIESDRLCIKDKKHFATLIASFNKVCGKPLKFGETSMFNGDEVTPKYEEIYEIPDTGCHKKTNIYGIRYRGARYGFR